MSGMKTFVLAVRSSDPESWEGPNLAVVELLPEQARRYLGLIGRLLDLQAEDPQVYSLSLWEYMADFYRLYHVDDPEATEERFRPFLDVARRADEDCEALEVPEAPAALLLEEYIVPTAGDQVVVTVDGVRWEAYHKFGGVRYETAGIGKAGLEQIAGG